MPNELTISADWEQLNDGPAEERACFAALGIRCDNVWLTEGSDAYVNRIRSAPLLSAYHLAEWLAWNWWRLRWEPRSRAADWAFAHRMTAIGHGYVWPNITIFSDGERTALVAKPAQERETTPFRYISDFAAIVASRHFESAVDDFIEQVRGKLRYDKVEQTNLDRIWQDVWEERRDPGTAMRRKLEALLGWDPDEADEATIERLIVDGKALGEAAMNEVAADHPQGGELLTAGAFRTIAADKGFDASPRDVVRLASRTAPHRSAEMPAWRLGGMAARTLREQETLGSGPISNTTLGRLAGVQERNLTDRGSGPSISFALDTGVATGRVVLRSKWETGRRFELARLLGDRIVGSSGGRLFPATRAYTYRQKMQRSFAAELLAPFEAVDDMLAGDYSMEKQQDAADHFNVSEMTIRTLLVNHHRLEREELDGEFETAAA